MKNWKRIGYVSIEAVITAALILSVGFFALLNLSGMGSALVQNGLNKLDGLDVFDEGLVDLPGIPSDENGYPDELNVNVGDVNPDSDFVFELTLDGNGYILVDYINISDLDVIIPKLHNGLPVVEIGEEAFSSMVEIEPDNWQERALNSVVFPDTIKKIGRLAFNGHNLTSVIIPDSVEIIDDIAFIYNQLSSIKFGKNIKTIGDIAFQGNDLASLVFPDSLTFIGETAFEGNPLTSVTFGNNLSSIGRVAFYNTQLVEVILPDSLVEIGANAFVSDKLRTIKFGNGVESFPYNWEYSGGSLESVILGQNISIINEGLFSSNSLTSIIVPNSVVEIGSWAFSDNAIKEIVIGDGVDRIGNQTFYNNPIESIRFLGDVPSQIGYQVFHNGTITIEPIVYVPLAYLDNYKAVAADFELSEDSFIGY